MTHPTDDQARAGQPIPNEIAQAITEFEAATVDLAQAPTINHYAEIYPAQDAAHAALVAAIAAAIAEARGEAEEGETK